jgi:hypothetical protein
MTRRNRPPTCTCHNAGRCSYCPRVAQTALREGRPPAQRNGIGAAIHPDARPG